MANVKFARGAQDSYNSILEKDPNTIYFCADTSNIYLGDYVLFEKDAFVDVSSNGKTITFSTHGTQGTLGSASVTLSDMMTAAEVTQAINDALQSVFHFMGSKQNYSDLPSSGNHVGDVWNVINAYGDYPAGTNFVWDGQQWVVFSGTSDLSGYVQKVQNATNGDIAVLTNDGSVSDSGVQLSQLKTKQSSVSDPTGSGDALSFISNISQNANGVISPTKKSVSVVTQGSNGLMLSTDKAKLDGIEAGAQANVQSDWNESDPTSFAYIANKPPINAAANDGDIIVKGNGTAVMSTSANSVTDAFVDIIPGSNVSIVPNTTNKTIEISSTWRGIQDNLASTSQVDSLSAKQGKVLNDTKVDKVAGKGLSTNDFTDAYMQKIDGIEAGAEVNVQSDWNVTDTASDAFIANKPTIPTCVSELQNDTGFITIANMSGYKPLQSPVSSPSASGTEVQFIDTIRQGANGVLEATKKTVRSATTSQSGLMSSSDKTKLNGIENGAQVNVIPDWNAGNESPARILNKPDIPDDTELVHTSGDEDISGIKNFLNGLEMSDTVSDSSIIAHSGYDNENGINQIHISGYHGNPASESELGVQLNGLYTTGQDDTEAVTVGYVNDRIADMSSIELIAGTNTQGRLVSAKLLKDNFDINGNTISIRSSSITVPTTVAQLVDASNYALNADVVHKTGAETISGAKTFSDIIAVRALEVTRAASFNNQRLDAVGDPVEQTDAANKKYVDSKFIAVGDDYYTKTQTDTLLAAKQDTLVSGTNIRTINDESILGSGNIQIEQSVQTTYQALKTLRDNGRLSAGMWYRITDYVCTTAQTNIQATSHPFDILVRADDESHLNENAFAMHHEGDTYFAGSKVQAWRLKYCIDNNTGRFIWADSSNGKGVIFYMKDEWGNECPYDFKNIQFKRKLTNGVYDPDNGTNTWCYTFNAYDIENDVYEDASIAIGKAVDDGCNTCFGNVIKPYCFDYDRGEDSQCYRLNNIVFLNTYEDQGGTYFMCYSNTFGDYCYRNTFGNCCYNNTFGNYCHNNTFGDECSDNTFGNDYQYNTLGNECGLNTFGNFCYYNTFGNSCGLNTFGNGCHDNIFGNYIKECTVFDGVVYCNITGGTSSSMVRYCQILNGAQGTNISNKLTITFETGKTYTQVAGKDSDGNLQIWIAADGMTGVTPDWEAASGTSGYIDNKPAIKAGTGGAHAIEESGCETQNDYAHAEGFDTVAAGIGAHSEGYMTGANGNGSHAEGYHSSTQHEYAHAEGYNNIACNRGEHAEGNFNDSHIGDLETYGHAGNTLSSIGFGTSDSDRKNAFEVMQNGDVYVYGIGGYDGTNPTSATSLQDCIGDIESLLAAI